jgi:hypothetical protein
MTGVLIPKQSIGRLDRLLGQATLLTADRGDDVASMVQEAMGIVLLMASTYPSSQPEDVAGLGSINATDCIDQALREVQSWDLALASALPDQARLRALLPDIRRGLNATTSVQG